MCQDEALRARLAASALVRAREVRSGSRCQGVSAKPHPVEANSFRSRLPRVFLLCALIAGTVVLLEPLKSLVSNWEEIELGFSEAVALLSARSGA